MVCRFSFLNRRCLPEPPGAAVESTPKLYGGGLGSPLVDIYSACRSGAISAYCSGFASICCSGTSVARSVGTLVVFCAGASSPAAQGFPSSLVRGFPRPPLIDHVRACCAEAPSCSVEGTLELRRRPTTRSPWFIVFVWSGHHQVRCCPVCGEW